MWDNFYSKIQGNQALCIHPIREGCSEEVEGELKDAGRIWKGRVEEGGSWPGNRAPSREISEYLCKWGDGLTFQCGWANIWIYKEN